MKLTIENAYTGNFAFCFMIALARVIDQSTGWVELYKNGESIGIIQPTTKDWWDRRDILKYYRWENYPEGDIDVCVMWLEDVCLTFDEFKERWI